MLGTHIFFLWSVRNSIARGDPDFTVFYTAGKILREGRGADLYDAHTQESVQREFTPDSDLRHGPLPYIHPPFEALLFLPLTFFSYPVAFILWSALNLCMLFVVSGLLRSSLASLQQISLGELAVGSLAFFPIFANFHQGQDAILLLLVVVLGFLALDKNADFSAGCWLGLGLFKYHLVIPLVLILAIWRGRKLVLGFAAAASCSILVSLGIVGWQGAVRYAPYTLHVISLPGFGRIPFRQLPNLLGLLTGWPILENGGWPIQIAVLACAAGLLIAVARLRAFANKPQFFKLCVSCAVILALLVGYSTNTYDLSLLVLPLAVIADYCLQLPSTRLAKTKMQMVLPAAFLIVSPLWFFLWMRWERINLIAVLLLWWMFAIRNEILRIGSNTGGPRSAAPLN